MNKKFARNLLLVVLVLMSLFSVVACDDKTDVKVPLTDTTVHIDLPDNGCSHAPCENAPDGNDIITIR